MKRILLLITISTLINLTTSAQYFRWARSINNGEGGAALACGNNFVAATGRFINNATFGNQTISSPDSSNAFVAAFDFSGNALWGKSITRNTYGIPQITVDQGQDIIISGAYKDSLYIDNLLFKATSSNNRWGIFVAKFKADGTLLWARSSSMFFDAPTGLTSVSTDYKGNIYLGCSVRSTISFGNQNLQISNTSMAFIVKYSANGVEQWAKNLNIGMLQTDPKVKAADNGEIYFSFLNDDPVATQVGISINKLNSNGTIIWSRIAHSTPPLMSYSYYITADDANNAYLVGNNTQGMSFEKGPGNFISLTNNNNVSLFAAKINSTGNWKWAKTIASGTNFSQFPLVVYSPKNGLAVSGSFSGSAKFGNDAPVSTTSNFRNSFIVTLDTAGTQKWKNIVNGTAWNETTGLTGDINGDYYISGHLDYISNPNSNIANFDSYTISTNSWKETFLAKIAGDANEVNGTVFQDLNNNAIKDTNEPPFTELILGTNANTQFSASEVNGFYKLFVPAGSYSINVPNPPKYYNLIPASHSVIFNGLKQTVSGKDFALQPIPNKNDVKITVTNLTPARPGMLAKYRLTFRNVGTTTLSDSISLKFNATNLSYVSALPNPAIQQTGLLKWTYQNLQPNEKRDLDITLNVSTSTVQGTALNTYAYIKPLTSDQFKNDNYDTLKQVVTASYDPNDKKVNYAQLSSSQVSNGTYLDYVIRFQNTGTDTAFTVIVRDSISNKLHKPSFELLSASHPYTFRLLENGMAEWRFDNIKLPDSTRNERDSHGFIRYRMQPKNNLVLGDEISSQAAIYFDYNAPVMTNYAVTRISNITGIRKENGELQAFELYPNPAKNYVMVAAELKKQTPATVILKNLLGQTISEVTLPANNQIHYQLPLNNLVKGVYIVQLETEAGRQTQRLVIQ